MRDNDDFFDKNVIAIMKLIEKNNFSVEIVGGAVRDYILSLKDSKIKSNNIDFDLATNASTEEIKKIFIDHKVILDGEKFGTVKVLLDEKLYEITTYRIDGSYRDKRRPERVYFTNEIKNDLSRRDFTINAIAMKSDREVIDFFGGMDDIENKIIRCVGNPEERFEEDYLRMFRA
ncbi:tRNA adenylyltransferase, partial [archaeon]|nr:tRNA adenylyltransferase [archaeon]NDF27963.1 tRNA adenylyltransferase [archaeon]